MTNEPKRGIGLVPPTRAYAEQKLVLNKSSLDELMDILKAKTVIVETNNECSITGLIYKDKLQSFISQKLDEQREEIRNWAKNRCEANMRVMGTDKWNSDLEDLIEKLK